MGKNNSSSIGFDLFFHSYDFVFSFLSWGFGVLVDFGSSIGVFSGLSSVDFFFW